MIAGGYVDNDVDEYDEYAYDGVDVYDDGADDGGYDGVVGDDDNDGDDDGGECCDYGGEYG